MEFELAYRTGTWYLSTGPHVRDQESNDKTPVSGAWRGFGHVAIGDACGRWGASAGSALRLPS